jgi:terminase, large subunit
VVGTADKSNAIYTPSDFGYAVQSFLDSAESKLLYDPFIPSLTDWAEATRFLPRGFTPFPGKFSWRGFEYLKEITDSLHPDAPFREVFVLKGTQVAYTVGVLENWQGFVIDKDPTSFAYINADEEMATNGFQLRLDALISQSNIEHRIFSQHKRRGQRKTGDTRKVKEFLNGFMMAFGGKSGNKLRSNSFQYMAVDEFEGFPATLGDEGDTISHIRRRTDAYKESYKILWGSTPKIDQTSLIKPLYESGDQRKYFIPCKHCGNMDFIKWRNVKFDRHENGLVDVVYDSDGRLKSSSVYLLCEKCGGKMTNDDKATQIPLGQWRPTATPVDSRFRSYHLPGLYSPVGFRSWENGVAEFCLIERGGSPPEKLQNWVNTFLGETFVELGEKPRIESIIVREKGYSVNTLPPGAKPIFVFVTADVQKDRIECEVVAWGRDAESWSIDYRVFEGDTSNPEDQCFQNLRSTINSQHVGFPVSLAGIDARYRTDAVLSFVGTFDVGVYPVFGHDDLGTDYFRYTKIVGTDQTRLDFNGNLLKQQLYSYLTKVPFPDGRKPVGLCHFPREYKREHYHQLTAEDRREVRGKMVWDKGSRKNEKLDIRYYNLGFLHVVRDFYREQLDLQDLPWGTFWDYTEAEVYDEETGGKLG